MRLAYARVVEPQINTHTNRASFTQKNIQFGIHSGALHRLGEKLKYMNGWFARF